MAQDSPEACLIRYRVRADSNDADEIIPNIWLGNRAAALKSAFHRERGIVAVFNCTRDIEFLDGGATYVSAHGFKEEYPRHYRVAIDDSHQELDTQVLINVAPDVIKQLIAEYDRCVTEWLRGMNGGAILIHCAAGMQRSASVVAMLLMVIFKLRCKDAIAMIQERRPIAFTPRANFEGALVQFEKQLFDRGVIF